MQTYTPTIGIEVHAELKTKTKMFCGSRNDPHAGEPNAHVCPVCLAHPGTLPTINKEAVKHVLKVGVALKGEIASYTEFDRKNYFYPDIPKGYQISQYKYPLVRGGELAGVAITRVHLEEDTARSQHDQGEGSLVDYNRAGVPLMELVTEPVIHDAKGAANFARELQLLLRTINVSDANMERGEMRVEANISVSKNDTLGTKVEVKNLNSFKAVEQAVEFEIKRQIKLLESGDKVVQETRGWDEHKGKTFSQRIKETADDYRYFPEPDLPKLDLSEISEFSLSRLTEELEETPDLKRLKYNDLGLSREQIEIIISDRGMAEFFDVVVKKLDGEKASIKLAANYVLTDMPPILLESKKSFETANADYFVSLMTLIYEEKITSRVAKDLLFEALFGDEDPKMIAEERRLIQTNSEDDILLIVKEVISENQDVVAEYKNGKEASIQFLVGQGMQKSKGTANPKLLLELLKREMT